MIHSQWYIFVATITMIVVGSVWCARIDANIEMVHCRSEKSISVMWFRMDCLLTLVSFFEQIFEDYVVKTREWFLLTYKAEYLHISAHKREISGSEVELSLADVLEKRLMDPDGGKKLKDVDKKMSMRNNQPEADRVSKDDILTNMQLALDGYLKGKKLEEIEFVNESETGALQRFEQYRDNVLDDQVKQLEIGNSIYEHAFWTLYHEDSPKIVNETIKKTCFAMTVTLALTYYILGARLITSPTIYYGSW